MRIIGSLCLLIAVLALAGCHDGLYAGSFGYGYSGRGVITAGTSCPTDYGWSPGYGYGSSYYYGRHGYSRSPYRHHHRSRYCD